MQIQNQSLQETRCANFLSKWTTLNFLAQIWGNCPITCDILVLITLRMFQRVGWKLEWANWRLKWASWSLKWAVQRWVHGLVILIFLIWRKNNISFSRYLDFCAFVKFTDFKIYNVIIGIASSKTSTCTYFFWILSTLKKKFGQILVCCTTNISNMFLAQDWKMETHFQTFLWFY